MREDLRPYVESTRYALTWDDVEWAEREGHPYPLAPAPPPESEPHASVTRDAFEHIFGVRP